MYTEHFGLKMLPFENVPDPVFFFDEGEHARVRQQITDSLKAGRGLLVVTGPIGSGKTTLSQMIKSDFSSKLQLIWMAMPPGNRMDFFMFIAKKLDLKPSSTEMVFIINEIRDALLRLNSEGGKCMIIIDESHLIVDDVLDAIRMLNNLEEGSVKLIQILLLGQDELMDIIKRPEMEPFRQRIATLAVIGKMTADRIKKYVSHRLQVAGGDASIFAETGWEALCKAFGSGNTPRTINSLCDRSLNIAFEREKKAVDIDDIYEVAEEMGLSKEIFHYKIELKKKGGNAPSAQVNGPEKDETLSSEPLLKKDAEIKVSTTEMTRPYPSISRNDCSVPTVSQSLKVPLLVLFISIVTFIMSISSYCETAGSPGIMICLLEVFF